MFNLFDNRVFGDDRISGAAEHVDGFELALKIKQKNNYKFSN